MITLGGLIKTIKTTRNFWGVFLLKLLQRKKRIVFKNGTMIELNLNKYLMIRDFFAKGARGRVTPMSPYYSYLPNRSLL